METVSVLFSIPAKAEQIPEIKDLLDYLNTNGYALDDVTDDDGPKSIKSFIFYDSSTHMDGWAKTIDTLAEAKVPFDMETESYSSSPEAHYIFRENMKEPYKYFGSVPSVSVDVLRDIIKNDPDYTREHLIEFLDSNYPELPLLEQAVKDWEKFRSSRINEGRT